MNARNEQIFSAMESYLSGRDIGSSRYRDQILADIDLVRRCYGVALKQREKEAQTSELAEEVVFEVLSWYPAPIRAKIATMLYQGSRGE
jgi:hypothetical protein